MPVRKDKETLELSFDAQAPAPPLSKSKFTAGHQCHRMLWWKVHEPLAVELQPDKVLQDRFDQGAQVAARARELFSGGVYGRHPEPGARLRADEGSAVRSVDETRRAMDSGASAVFEA